MVVAVTLGLGLLGTGVAPAGGAEAGDLVVSESDLPAGYEFARAPITFTGIEARYVTIDDCVVEDNAVFDGPEPKRHSGAFENDRTDGSGSETVYEFPTSTDAKGFYAAFKPYFTDAPKCKKVSTLSGSKTVPYGRFQKLDVGKVGSDRAGMTFDSATSTTHSYIAIFRTSSSVTVVLLRDKGVSSKQFVKLVADAAGAAAA